MNSGDPQHPGAASFWAKLRAESRESFPNPERVGCPPEEFLRQMAMDRASVAFDDPRVSHVVRCSPCFARLEELTDESAVLDARDEDAPSAK